MVQEPHMYQKYKSGELHKRSVEELYKQSQQRNHDLHFALKTAI
jgi:hypothetical protein